MRPRSLLTAIFIASALISAVQARSTSSSAGVVIIDYAFEPVEQTITVGDSITWQNDGQELHNVFDLGGAWESPALNTGQTYTFTFTIPGTYPYVCSIHSGMLGTITVAEPQPQPLTKVYLATIQH